MVRAVLGAEGQQALPAAQPQPCSIARPVAFQMWQLWVASPSTARIDRRGEAASSRMTYPKIRTQQLVWCQPAGSSAYGRCALECVGLSTPAKTYIATNPYKDIRYSKPPVTTPAVGSSAARDRPIGPSCVSHELQRNIVNAEVAAATLWMPDMSHSCRHACHGPRHPPQDRQCCWPCQHCEIARSVFYLFWSRCFCEQLTVCLS